MKRWIWPQICARRFFYTNSLWYWCLKNDWVDSERNLSRGASIFNHSPVSHLVSHPVGHVTVSLLVSIYRFVETLSPRGLLCVISRLLAGEPWFPHSSVLFFFTNLVWHVCFPCCLVALAAPILVNATCRKPRGDSGRKENILCKLLQCRVRPRANASPQKRQKPWHAKTGLFWSFQSRWPMVQSRGSQCFCAWCLPSPTGHRGEGGEALLKDFLFGLSGECYFFMGMTWCFCSWYLPYGQAATTSAVGMGNAGSLMTLQLHVTFLTFPTS